MWLPPTKIGGGANDRKLLYSNYIHTFNNISYNNYYSICLSYGFDYSFEQTTIKQKTHFCFAEGNVFFTIQPATTYLWILIFLYYKT